MPLLEGQMARRMVDDLGEEVDIKTYTETGEDDYGDPTYDETTHTVMAIIAKANDTPNITLEQLGDARSFPIELHIKDDAISDLSVGATGKTPEVVHGSDEYEVQDIESSPFGTTRLACRRKRK